MNDDKPASTQPDRPVWQTCLDLEGQQADHYLDFVNQPLLDMVGAAPQRVLELGCAGGMFGLKLKERFPGARVVGIEAGRAAAGVAAKRLDRVICARLEALDFAAEGLAEERFDTVIAADILEHLVNPWDLLVRVRSLLAPNAQLLASIPNVRNLGVVAELLVNGRWQYRDRGLLDITHLRFFTLAEIKRMLDETGYACEEYTATISSGFVSLYEKYKGHEKVAIDIGRVKLADVTPRELFELCAQQFLLRCRAI
jgi:O-antigen biosynthesis protein